MFLPDRYIKGECPNCGAKDQYGDSCEVCGTVYAPTDLNNPYSTLSGATPVLQDVGALFLQAVATRAASSSCSEWTHEPGTPAARGRATRSSEWFEARAKGAGRLGHLARRALLRHSRSRTRPASISTCGWTRRSATSPASRTTSARQREQASTFDDVPRPTRRPSRSISSARTSSISTRCSGRRCCNFAGAARCPTNVYVHGFLTVDGEKMSKSRGTGITR